MSAPATHGPCMVSATAVGPRLHLPAPISRALAVGKVDVGPTPETKSFDPVGDRKKLGLMSPSPKAWSMPGPSAGWLMIGVIQRVIRFQSLVSVIGMTGWTFSTQTVLSFGPVLKLKLCWNGTLIRSAMGF